MRWKKKKTRELLLLNPHRTIVALHHALLVLVKSGRVRIDGAVERVKGDGRLAVPRVGIWDAEKTFRVEWHISDYSSLIVMWWGWRLTIVVAQHKIKLPDGMVLGYAFGMAVQGYGLHFSRWSVARQENERSAGRSRTCSAADLENEEITM